MFFLSDKIAFMRCLEQFFIIFALFFGTHVLAKLPSTCSQAIVGTSRGWNDSHVQHSLIEKNSQGQWQQVLGPFKGRLGHAGLVLGRGLHKNPAGSTLKREGDGRSPAGIFRIEGLYTTCKIPVKHHPRLPELRVTSADLWVSDVRRPDLYNRHIRLNQPARTAWEKKEQMRLNDHAHSIKLLIGHNRDKPIAGAGSSIFFHIWRRNGAAATAGCTTMSEGNIRAIIARLDPAKKPLYILLPREQYMQLRGPWRLP